ncbi:MAG: amidase family protein [Balneolaceae bacterium]|nr:amidase family protein [Balneolaceae bacterium]
MKEDPLTRNTEDAALVFNAILGPDGLDQSVIDLPFNYDQSLDLSELKVGYLESAFNSDYSNRSRDSLSLVKLRELGFNLTPIEFPDFPVSSLSYILSAEAATAFDQLTLSNRDDELGAGREATPGPTCSAPPDSFLLSNIFRPIGPGGS